MKRQVQRTHEDSWNVAKLLTDNIEKLLSQAEKVTTKVVANLHDKLALYYLNIEQDLTASFEHQKKAILGAIDDTTLNVMKKMLKVLNKISELSSNGGWNQKTVASWLDKAISSRRR